MCPPPPVVHNAIHSMPAGHAHDTRLSEHTTVEYQCRDGYVMSKGSVNKAWCVGGGIWVGPDMTCISK